MGREDPRTDPYESYYGEEPFDKTPYTRSEEFQSALDSSDCKGVEEAHALGLAQLYELQDEVNDAIRIAIAKKVMKVLGRMLTEDEQEDLRDWYVSETRWLIGVIES